MEVAGVGEGDAWCFVVAGAGLGLALAPLMPRVAGLYCGGVNGVRAWRRDCACATVSPTDRFAPRRGPKPLGMAGGGAGDARLRRFGLLTEEEEGRVITCEPVAGDTRRGPALRSLAATLALALSGGGVIWEAAWVADGGDVSGGGNACGDEAAAPDGACCGMPPFIHVTNSSMSIAPSPLVSIWLMSAVTSASVTAADDNRASRRTARENSSRSSTPL